MDIILRENFQLSGAEAMERVIPSSTHCTTVNLRRGEFRAAWFTEMMSLATDAGLGTGNQKMNFAWYKMDSELRTMLP